MNWVAAAVVAAVLVAVWMSGADGFAFLRYERAGVLSGEGWRLASGHLVHAGGAHLWWNIAGLALVCWLFAGEYTLRGWCLVLLASTAAIDAGFLLLEPGIAWYVGFSGVLHGCMAAGLVAWLARERDPIVLAVAAVFAGKLAWEHVAGPLTFTSGTLAVPVVVEAHTYGAAGGALAALWLWYRRPDSARSL